MTDQEQKTALEQISTGQVSMHSRSYFAVRTALLLLCGAVAALAVLFLASFVVFYLQVSGAVHLSEFGLSGLRDLLLSLPLLVVASILLLVVMLIWFTQRYPLSYRRPLLYSLLVVVVLVVGGGIAVAKTRLHAFAYMRYANPQAPVLFRSFYEQPHHGPLHNALVGEIQEIEEHGLSVHGPACDDCQIVFVARTRYIDGSTFTLGEWVVARGRMRENILEAWDIRKISAPPFVKESYIEFVVPTDGP